MPPRTKKIEVPKSTAQQLGSIVKSSRDIMRKDKGLNGDLDRLPMLTWIMFLKFLDDMEQGREEEAKLAGKKFRQAIDPPYRWRDWANKPEGMTGPELIAFINHKRRQCGRTGRKAQVFLPTCGYSRARTETAATLSPRSSKAPSTG
jgi:type I restriction enzyme M protein